MNIFITGGAGYVGSSLVPRLLRSNCNVTVYDLFIYGNPFKKHQRLKLVKGDIRDKKRLLKYARKADDIIHLASISNDPSFELNPELGKSINYDAIPNIIEAAHGVERLIFPSSASVYGIQDRDTIVNEEAIPKPITDYAKYKLEAEKMLLDAGLNAVTIIRCATICGYAPRLRLDLAVNILTSHALINKKIRVFGGEQQRPNVNIEDVTRLYEQLLYVPTDKNRLWNFGFENLTLDEIAGKITKLIPNVEIEHVSTDDNRSYFMDSRKINFDYYYNIDWAIKSLERAYFSGEIEDGLNNPMYHNVKRMKELDLK